MPALGKWSSAAAYMNRDTEWCQFPPIPYFFASILSALCPHISIDTSLQHAVAPSIPRLMSRALDPSRLFSSYRKLVIQTIAVSCASVSVLAAIVASFWFCRMRKRFRHRLIMLLIYGDLTRATWYFIFAIASFRRGTIRTHSLFCQASGFLIQYGTETSDYAVLIIAIHSAIQVFRPSVSVRSDVFYRHRNYIYIGGFAIPALMAGLAFVNPTAAYVSNGPFCSLPLRPYWYRLALAWIPRYLIGSIILGLAVAIYAHVGFKFRDFTKASDRSLSVSTSTTIPMLAAMESGAAMGSPTYRKQSNVPLQESEDPGSSADRKLNHTRRASGVTSIAETIDSRSSSTYHHITGSIPPRLSNASERNDCNQVRPSITSISSVNTANTAKTVTYDNDTRIFCALTGTSEPLRSTVQTDSTRPNNADNTDTAPKRMALQRSRIHRQLRLLFLYPMAYICMWIIPFTVHCMQYNNYWAQHPPYVLSCLFLFCLTIMGAVDCLIFSLREKPWRHIPASDRTFWGSFHCWRKLELPTSEEPGMKEKRNSSVGTNPGSDIPALPPQVSGLIQPPRLAQFRLLKSSDQQQAAADMAYERLKIEQEERRKSNQAKGSAALERDTGEPERRDWFERAGSQSSSNSENSEKPESPKSPKTGIPENQGDHEGVFGKPSVV
ncbi:hypothetical protein AOQ84DRAFT_81888 [Glonium stellatum]|uniref:G protein-coupled receptor GPR1 n=1 Tax=Glonium stellatum TaxID=574774 RepID=A0A8E2FAX6_9PEZI|nr:hypothetical protein AOQ84DRAFT_81888 [Glonium stellatum]